MLKNKHISELLIKNFILSLEVSPIDDIFKSHLGDGVWEDIRLRAIEHNNCSCQGCGYKSEEEIEEDEFLELHIAKGEPQSEESYEFALLCKTCHTLQHIDEASDKGWIKLVNSLYNQKELISICRSGNSNLNSKIRSREIILLETDPKKYSSDLEDNMFNRRSKMKAVFGKNFPPSRLK